MQLFKNLLFTRTKQTLFKWLMRGSIVGTLATVFMMPVFMQTTYAMNAVPNYGQAACLEPGLSTFIVGPNEITGNGDITNGCPANVSGSANISATIVDCPGVGTGNSGSSFTYQISPNQTYSQGFDVKAGCVVCVNHKPVDYPPFHVKITLSNIQGTFYYKGIIYRTGATPSSLSVTDYLSNNPPEVFPPCP